MINGFNVIPYHCARLLQNDNSEDTVRTEPEIVITEQDDMANTPIEQLPTDEH